jgi:micrococcal nuclease
MKHIFLAAAISGIISLAVPASANDGPTEPAYLYRAKVVNIVDGDTIDVDIDVGFYVWIKDQRIRLFGIDSPERKAPTLSEWKAAKAYLTDLIDGKEIILQTVKGKDGADRRGSFGRWLGTVYLNGSDINQQMIDTGHAVPFRE